MMANFLKHALLAFSIFLLPSVMAARSTEPPEAYTPIQWTPVPSPLDLSHPPSLESGESVNLFDGALYARGSVIWIVHRPQNEIALLVWTIGGAVRRIDPGVERINGMAYDTSSNEILVRSGSKIRRLDPESFEPKGEITLTDAGSNWNDMIVIPSGLAALENGSLAIYSLKSGMRVRTVNLPLEKTQRIFPFTEGRILLWSSFSGAALVPFNPETGGHGESLTAPVPHQTLFKASALPDGQIGLFDPLTSVYTVIVHTGSAWIDLAEGAQRMGDWLAVRSSPVRNRIVAVITVTAKGDTDASEIVAVIPPAHTYSQDLENEILPGSARPILDSYGNRHIRMAVPALKKGETFTETIFAADLKRYSISFNINKLNHRLKDLRPPEMLGVYLRDHATYKINDPVVVSARRKLIGGSETIADAVQRVYMHSVGMRYVGDGRFDPAPVVIKQGHGACTEHTFVQVSLLRGAGIPARYIWNWLPGSDDPDLNHKIAEAWIPDLGWIPLEPLSAPRSRAGTTFAHHLIFAAMENWNPEVISWGDRLASFTRESGRAERSSSVSVQWKLLPAEGVATERGLIHTGPDESRREPMTRNRIVETDAGRRVE